MYGLRMENRKMLRYDDFEPNETNWLVRAEKGEDIIYFLNMAAYNNWARTTCPISAYHIEQGYYRGYSLTKNF